MKKSGYLNNGTKVVYLRVQKQTKEELLIPPECLATREEGVLCPLNFLLLFVVVGVEVVVVGAAAAVQVVTIAHLFKAPGQVHRHRLKMMPLSSYRHPRSSLLSNTQLPPW